MKQPISDTQSFVKYVVRPDFLAVVGSFVVMLVTGGIAWGVLTNRVEAQEKTNKALWEQIQNNKTASQPDHDTLIAIQTKVEQIQKDNERILSLLEERVSTVQKHNTNYYE